MLTPAELQALDDWRFSKRMPSRAAAVRELLKRGLAAEGWSVANAGVKSGSFGVTGGKTASEDAGSEAAGSEVPGSEDADD